MKLTVLLYAQPLADKEIKKHPGFDTKLINLPNDWSVISAGILFLRIFLGVAYAQMIYILK